VVILAVRRGEGNHAGALDESSAMIDDKDIPADRRFVGRAAFSRQKDAGQWTNETIGR